MKTNRTDEGHKIYNYLRNSFSKIPSDIRYGAIVSTLVAYCSMSESYQNCVGKLKVDRMENSVKAFITLNIGRDLVKNDNKLRTGIQRFLESYRLSEKAFHPAGMIMSLNGAAWYMRNLHPKMSIMLGEKAVYFSGKYSELNKYFFAVDTLFAVKLTQQDKLLPTVRLIDSFSYSLNTNQSSHFKLVLKETRRIYSLSSTTGSCYENSTDLRKYLKKHSSNISKISSATGLDRKTVSGVLNGKAKNINGETLRRLIVGLRIIPDIMNSPKQMLAEWFRLQRNKSAESQLRKMLNMTIHDRQIRIFCFYSSMVMRKEAKPLLVRKGCIDAFFDCLDNSEELLEMAHRKFELEEFLSFIEEPSSYEIARAELAKTFVSQFHKRRQKTFMKKYFENSEETREALDQFMRNYARYDREWGVRLENEEYTAVAKEARLKSQPFLISMYCFERRKEQRIVGDFFADFQK